MIIPPESARDHSIQLESSRPRHEQNFPDEYVVFGEPTGESPTLIEGKVLKKLISAFKADPNKINLEEYAHLAMQACIDPRNGKKYFQVIDSQKIVPARSTRGRVGMSSTQFNEGDLYIDSIANRDPSIYLSWFHTHPGLAGVGPSNPWDYYIMENFFSLPERVALIYDPLDKMISATIWDPDNREAKSLGGIYLTGAEGLDFAQNNDFSTATLFVGPSFPKSGELIGITEIVKKPEAPKSPERNADDRMTFLPPRFNPDGSVRVSHTSPPREQYRTIPRPPVKRRKAPIEPEHIRPSAETLPTHHIRPTVNPDRILKREASPYTLKLLRRALPADLAEFVWELMSSSRRLR